MQPIDLNGLMGDLRDFYPVLVLCVGCVLIIITQLFNRSSFFISLLTVAAHLYDLEIVPMILGGCAIITILISGRQQRMEFHLLIISILIGAEILMQSRNFIMLLLSFELVSISSYILTSGTVADKQRAEAAWKFFIYGSVATAVMIFGMSYLYGATGTITPGEQDNSTLALIGSLMVLGGLLFKAAAAPFHLWAPDVYESAPAPIVAFLSVVPKLASFVVILKFNFSPTIIATVAILTIVIGTLAAISQTNAKRMMAYSSVAQAGFFLAIIAAMPQGNDGWEALGSFLNMFSILVFYAVIFATMNYVVFIAIDRLEAKTFSDFSGVGNTNTLAAIAITLALVSLTGLPPMAGFTGKLLIFKSVWSAYTNSNDSIFLVLFVVGLGATVASLFFYLKIPFYAFFRRPEEKQTIKIPLFTNLLLVILVGILLVLFIAPGVLLD